MQLALEDVEELFPFVTVGFSAAGVGGDAEEMRFHYGATAREQFDAHAFADLQDFPFLLSDQRRLGLSSIEKVENVGFVEARQFAQGSNGGAHMGALQGAQESNGDTDGFCDLGEG